MTKKNGLKYTIVSGLLGCLILLSGCTHSRELSYKPVIGQQPTKNITLSLDAIADYREDAKTVACYRNSYYIPIAFAESTRPPRTWVARALQTELRNAGYFIKRSDDASRYHISGEVYEAYGDTYINSAYDVRVALSLFKDKSEVFSKVYKGHRWTLLGPASLGPFLIGSPSKKLGQCLQDICQEFVSDVNTYFENNALIEIQAD